MSESSDNHHQDVSNQGGQQTDASAQQAGLTARDVLPDAPKPSAAPAEHSAPSAGAKGAQTMTDVAAASIERSLGGGGAAAEQINLGDAIYAPPAARFTVAARDLAVQANLTEGRVTVTNMSLQVDGKEIRGPVSYTKSGQEFIIDQSTQQKYKIIPASDSLPNGGILPMSRGKSEGEPVPIQSSKVVPGIGDGGTYGGFSRPPMGEAAQQRQPQAQPQGDAAPPKPPQAQPQGDAAPPKPQHAQPQGDATAPSAQPGQLPRQAQGDGVGAAQPAQPGRQQQGDLAAAAAANQAHSNLSNLSPQQWQQFQNLQQQGAFATKPDGTFVRPDVAAGAAQLLGLNKNDLNTISQLKNATADQLQQTFQRGGDAQQPRPLDNAQQSRPLDNAQQSRPLDNAQQSQQPMKLTAEQVNYLQQQFAQKPELLQQLVQSPDPRAQQLLQQLQQAGVQFPGGDRGTAHGAQAGDVPAARTQQQQLDGLLAAQLAQNSTRQALADSLSMAQAGKLPLDGVQQQRQLQDLVRAIGPENMTQLRQMLLENQGNSPLKLEGKFDSPTQTNIRQLLELMVTQKPSDVQSMQSSLQHGNVDRFLDLLRSNDRLNLLTRTPEGDGTRANLVELNRLLREFNAANGLESGKGALTFKDIVNRGLDERGNSTPERRDFNVRAQDEATIRTLMSVIGRRETDGAMPTDGVVSRPEHKVDARLDNRSEPVGPKPEDALRNIMTRQLGDKSDAPSPADRNVQNAIAASADKNLIGDADKLAEVKRPETKDEENKRREDERKAGKTEPKPDEQAVDAAALLAAMNAKKRKLEDEKDDKEKVLGQDKKEPEKRQKYIVKPGDTLESIAQQQLRDKLLAGLIFEINNETIPTRIVNGRKVAELIAKMVIWLPTSTDIREYRVRLLNKTSAQSPPAASQFHSAEEELAARFGDQSDAGTSGGASLEEMEESARVAYQARRQHIESLLGPLSTHHETGRPRYVVRLGDSLKSIAMKHPSLNDVGLWKLLAQVNSLPDKVDEKGNPVATIKRGQTLNLPLPQEIEHFKRRDATAATRPSKPSERASLGGIELETRPCPSCGRVTFVSAVICPGCGGDFTGDTAGSTEAGAGPAQESSKTKARSPRRTASKLKPVSAVAAEADLAAGKPFSADGNRTKAAGGAPTNRNQEIRTPGGSAGMSGAAAEPAYHVATEFTDTARLVQTGNPEQAASEFKLRLELRHQDNWVPVVACEIYDDLSLRHEFKPAGARKTIRIDLPPSAAIELAHNDLASNWQSYCDKFIGTRAPD